MVSVLQRRVTAPTHLSKTAPILPRTPVTIASPDHSVGQDNFQGTQKTGSAPAAIALTDLNSQDIARLTQTQRPQGFAQVLSKSPSLKAHLSSFPEGETISHLLTKSSQVPLSQGEVKTLQRFVVSQGENINYRGHSTGIDGHYGRRTHQALQSFFTKSLPPPSTKDSFTQLFGNKRRNLGDFSRFLKSHPHVKSQLETLPQGKVLIQSIGSVPSVQNVKTLQRVLSAQGHDLSYKGHSTGVDGDYGQRTYTALKSAFLSAIESKTVAPNVPSRPPKQPPAPTPDLPPVIKPGPSLPPSNGPLPRYDRMFEDGLLDVTVAIGYDEGGKGYAPANLAEEKKIVKDIEARGYVQDNAKAMALLKDAGHELSEDYAALYVKENVSEVDGKPVHGIIRLIKAGHEEDTGAALRAAAIEGMNQSDVFMYGGHARYGNGPDFDNKFKVTVDWTGVENAPTQGKVTYDDYSDLKHVMVKNDNQYQAIADFKKLQTDGKVEFGRSNEGNIRMATQNLHKAEFGSYIMNESLKGTDNTLAQEITGDKYRVWLFNGCRTHDYLDSIREQAQTNPAFNTQNLDLFMTKQTLYWSNISNSLGAFMNGIEAQEGTTDMIDRLRSANPQHASAPTHSRQGFDDNPVRK